MKKKQTFITHKTVKTESIDIIQEFIVSTPENFSLIASSPLSFKDSSGISYQFTTDEDINCFKNDADNRLNYNYLSDDESFTVIKNDIKENENIEIFKVDNTEKIKDQKTYCNSDNFQRLTISTIIATGTGLAMMPIFNNLIKNSEQFGVDVHSNKILFELSTANTFVVTFCSSFATMYNFIKKQQEDIVPESKNICIFMSKIGASWSIILPLGLLWTVELHNQKISDSQGFDEFMAWATFTTIPLVIDRIVESVNTVDDINKNSSVKLQSAGSQLIVYGLTGLSIAGRAIAYTEIAKAVSEAMGIDETTALITGIIAGGLFGSGGTAIFEYQAIRSLFEQNQDSYTVKKVLNAATSVIEGAWLTLPLVSLGLKATEEWNPLLKGFLFTPLFISHSTFEAKKLYNNIDAACNTISDGFSSLKNWCFGSDDIQLVGDNGDYSNE